ncbi:unnamed protein product [Effrenium voratum]|nr:unnamed protein product [Effrenium voratum]
MGCPPGCAAPFAAGAPSGASSRAPIWLRFASSRGEVKRQLRLGRPRIRKRSVCCNRKPPWVEHLACGELRHNFKHKYLKCVHHPKHLRSLHPKHFQCFPPLTVRPVSASSGASRGGADGLRPGAELPGGAVPQRLRGEAVAGGAALAPARLRVLRQSAEVQASVHRGLGLSRQHAAGEAGPLRPEEILAFGAGGAAGVEYRWFVRWRPDFVAFKRVLHPSKLSQDCIACRFRQVGGMKQVTKGMLSWDPPNCLLRRESSIPCGDCDDQVFMVPQKFAQAALVDLTNRSKSAAYVFFVHKRRGENGLTMAWENNVRVHHICPLEVEGTLDKYVTKWRKWTMPSKYFNQTVGADPGQPALIRPCSCCCKTAPLRTCSTPRCDSVNAVAREHGGLCADEFSLPHGFGPRPCSEGLVHAPFLPEYFKSEYLLDLNPNTKFGMGGKLAVAFAELVEEIRQARHAGYWVVAPRDFKRIFSDFKPQFAGWKQQDAQEFLSMFLAGLSEDVNRTSQKPYSELRDSEHRPDAEVALEYWQSHCLRERSAVAALYSGQFRSVLRCKCGYTNHSFEAFSFLPIPIPEHQFRWVTCMVRAASSESAQHTTRVCARVPKQGSVKQLLEARATELRLAAQPRLAVARISALGFLRALHGQSLERHLYSYSAALKGLEESGQWQQALGLLDELLRPLAALPTKVAGDFAQAISLLDLFRVRRLRASALTRLAWQGGKVFADFTACAKAVSATRAWRAAVALAQEAVDMGQMDAILLSSVLSSVPGEAWTLALQLLNTRRALSVPWRRGLHLLRRLRARTQQPGVVSFNQLLALPVPWKMALQLLQRLEAPSLTSFNAALARLRIGGWRAGLGLFEGLRPDVVSVNSALALPSPWRVAVGLFHSAQLKLDVISFSSVQLALRSAAWVLGLAHWQHLAQSMGGASFRARNVAATSFSDASAWRQALGVAAPDLCGLNCALRISDRWPSALAAVEAAGSAAGLRPDVVSHGSVIAGFERAAEWRFALNFLRSRCWAPNVFCYNSASSACARAGEWPICAELVRTVSGVSWQPDLITLNSALRATSVEGHWRVAKVLLKAIRQVGFQLSPVSCGSLTSSCGRCWRRAFHWLDYTKSAGVEVGEIPRNAVISACEKAAAWQAAVEAERGGGPSLVGCNSLLSACEKGSQWQMALHLLLSLPREVIPDEITFNAVLGAVLRVALDAGAYVSAMSVCEKASQWTAALDLLSWELTRESTIVGTGRSELRALQRASLQPEGAAYSSAISSCGKAEQWQRALQLPRGDAAAAAAAVLALERGSQWQAALGLFLNMRSQERSELGYLAAFGACEKGTRWRMGPQLLSAMQQQLLRPAAVASTAAVAAVAEEWPQAVLLLAGMTGAWRFVPPPRPSTRRWGHSRDSRSGNWRWPCCGGSSSCRFR